jgi:hypothetical protein
MTISQTASELLKPENIRDESKRAALAAAMRQEIERSNVLIAELPQIIK